MTLQLSQWVCLGFAVFYFCMTIVRCRWALEYGGYFVLEAIGTSLFLIAALIGAFYG